VNPSALACTFARIESTCNACELQESKSKSNQTTYDVTNQRTSSLLVCEWRKCWATCVGSMLLTSLAL